jgi:hypothetical protein
MQSRKECLREIIEEANRIVKMLQGTVSLEGQGLDKQALRQIKKRVIRRILNA